MADKELAEFIAEARRRGFGDLAIKNALINHGWTPAKIEGAFVSLIEKNKFKNQVTLFLDEELLGLLEKRAKKNMLNVSEQIEDILRRSTLNQKKKKSIYDGKLDDTLVSIFSRQRTGPKRK
ncbi:MAG: hypothetical protein PHH00_01490 [Candidatus Nanoarchaeia archaeon]|nr:hypothetical protein [Candidatus Nanoarchaeia archaeon]